MIIPRIANGILIRPSAIAMQRVRYITDNITVWGIPHGPVMTVNDFFGHDS